MRRVCVLGLESLSFIIKQVRDAARRTGKPAGIGVYGSPFELNTLKRVTEAGYQVILVGGDELFLTHSCQQIKKLRTEL